MFHDARAFARTDLHVCFIAVSIDWYQKLFISLLVALYWVGLVFWVGANAITASKSTEKCSALVHPDPI